MVIFLSADHGMRYGEWYKLENGGQEHRLPMMFVIASRSLIERIPYSDDILSHNSNRLISKFDIYETLKFLSNVPYYDSFNYSFYKHNQPVSLFNQKISNERLCEDVFIDSEYCPCPTWVDYQDFSTSFITKLANVIIEQINSDAVYNANNGWKICQKITLKKVVFAQWSVQEYKILIKLTLVLFFPF